MRIGHRTSGLVINRNPLNSTGWTLGHFPIKSEQVSEIQHTPFGWGRRPGTFKTRGHCVLGVTFTATVLPTEALLFQRFASRLYTDTLAGLVRAVRLTKGMSAGD